MVASLHEYFELKDQLMFCLWQTRANIGEYRTVSAFYIFKYIYSTNYKNICLLTIAILFIRKVLFWKTLFRHLDDANNLCLLLELTFLCVLRNINVT